MSDVPVPSDHAFARHYDEDNGSWSAAATVKNSGSPRRAYRATRNAQLLCMSRTIDEDPRMAAQRSPGLRGEWCVQQMTYETDILPPFLLMPCWIRRACTYLCLSVIWPALRRMRQMTASEFRHEEVAHGVTHSSDGVFTI
ncbi:hypothetical protein HBI56_168140 [Parastagonospora nodorum]|uniref:Uncharacterized protein n=1 Tax=Phaeosphaeria nodorum (strain SN15 / ATCC MYA-4574 / FGSC 10173) TaxID=321614 RepID=A0A7U2I512_PHANO|nr:hypothetical protein HBH56_050600 [Parastagonospora nodorum]QRD02075.1 hypothetical protein JI435_440210 [Parastagonospora nodorum SN15]KAH3935831.1 hypothetical protein HBH54_036390 [Parastagonospora nodorum]KAH3942633.1 hypothetical protein HBH53_183570 [Parastagonospora nodorum]KAH3964167.1 hypothetical protein HBH51_162260 [Parastagonospora nodorum]